MRCGLPSARSLVQCVILDACGGEADLICRLMTGCEEAQVRRSSDAMSDPSDLKIDLTHDCRVRGLLHDVLDRVPGAPAAGHLRQGGAVARVGVAPAAAADLPPRGLLG